ncbi:MAG: ParB/RepB/Spo0J family partition protein [Patescibacteria group bacterium]
MPDEKPQHYYSNSIFWVEVDRIKPNPFQPRKHFDEANLTSLADSIRQYGVLQPLTVTRKEIERPEEGIFVEYELIAGERRLRASKLAGLTQVPVVIRAQEDTDKMKLELAIIENLQREDLNPVDRAKAFQQLYDQFGLKHHEIGTKVGKSREYVSNTLRILLLPTDMQNALSNGEITEGHTRPLLMLSERIEEQSVLFKEIVDKKMTVRESELIARRIAVDRARKIDLPPEMLSIEKALTEKLGTRVRIEKREKGGKVLIDFFSQEDLAALLSMIGSQLGTQQPAFVGDYAEPTPTIPNVVEPEAPPDEDLYSMRNFSL